MSRADSLRSHVILHEWLALFLFLFFIYIFLYRASLNKKINKNAAYTLYVALNEVTLYAGARLHGVHRTCAKAAAVSRATNHAKYAGSLFTKRKELLFRLSLDCLLMGTPNYIIQPLQKIQNFAARLVLLAPRHHHATLASHFRTY